jgi:hypothetical protein
MEKLFDFLIKIDIIGKKKIVGMCGEVLPPSIAFRGCTCSSKDVSASHSLELALYLSTIFLIIYIY